MQTTRQTRGWLSLAALPSPVSWLHLKVYERRHRKVSLFIGKDMDHLPPSDDDTPATYLGPTSKVAGGDRSCRYIWKQEHSEILACSVGTSFRGYSFCLWGFSFCSVGTRRTSLWGCVHRLSGPRQGSQRRRTAIAVHCTHNLRKLDTNLTVL